MGHSKKNKRQPKRSNFYGTDPGFQKSRNRSGPSFPSSSSSKRHSSKSHGTKRRGIF